MRRAIVWKSVVYGAGMGLGVLLLVGIPSGVIPNPFFVRPLDARATDFVFLGAMAALAVALGATYGVPAACPPQDGKALGSGLLLFVGIGCPVCNKVVLLLVGATGAVTYFEPIQPLFSLAAFALMAVALALRLRDIRRFGPTAPAVPASAAPTPTEQ